MKKKWLLIPAIMAAMVVGATSLFASFVSPQVEHVAAATPAGSDVYFVTSGGTKCNFGSDIYYKNNGTVGDSSNYNIAYDSALGIMLLDGYDGRTIYSNSTNKLIVIPYTNATNYIDAYPDIVKTGYAYGIYSKGPLDIKGIGTGATRIRLSENLNNSTEFRGIHSETDITIGDASSGSTDIQIVATKTSRYKYGIYSTEGSVDIAGRANVSMTMTNDNRTYGIYLKKEGQSLNVNLTSGKTLLMNITDSSAVLEEEHSAVYGIRADGNVFITGEGDLWLQYNGTCYSSGIYLDGLYNEYSSLKLDKLSEATIKGFENGLDVYCNNSDGNPSDDYDVIISDVESLLIDSDFEDNFGISVYDEDTYGVKIVDSKVVYEGVGTPVLSYGINGFDVYGASEVIFHADKPINASNKTCNIEISGGYLELGYSDGGLPDNELVSDSPYFELGVTNYIIDSSWTERFSNGQGGYTYGLPSDEDCAQFIIRGITKDMGQDIELGDVKLTKSKPCYVNGADYPSEISTNYNARFDFDKNILYLVNYDGGKIYYDSAYDDVLRIVVQGNSTINSDDYGIQIVDKGSLEILSAGQYLKINVSSGDNIVYGIYLENGSLTLLEDIDLKIKANDTANNGAEGICLNDGDLYICDHTDLDIQVYSGNDTALCKYDSAIDAKTVYIDVYAEDSLNSYICLDTSNCQNGSYALRCTSLIISSVVRMDVLWNSKASVGGPCYPENALDLIDDITVNKNSDTGFLIVLMGAPVDLYVINGTSALAENKWPEYSTAQIFAETIPDVPFTGWYCSIDGAIDDPDSEMTFVDIGTDAITVEATYDIIKGSKPRFDSRGNTDKGFVSFDLYGAPKKVRLVTAIGDESTIAVLDDQFDFDTVVKAANVEAGDYRIAAQYETASKKLIWLFSETFEIKYGQAALKYEMSFSNGATEVQYHIKETAAGEFIIPEFMHEEPESLRFTNWYVTAEKKSYSPGDKIQVHNDITFVPQFENRTAYTVSFDENGGTGSMSDVTAYDGRNYTLPSCGFTAPVGHEFSCWEINGKEYSVGDEITISGDVTLKAVWVESSGTGTSSSAPTSEPSGDTSTSQPVDPSTTEPGGDTSQPTSSPTDPTSGEGGESTAPVTDTSETPVDPTPEEQSGGIGGGAIAGIIIGSVLVLGVGGFALTWFVILKKSWADFVAILPFKKK